MTNFTEFFENRHNANVDILCATEYDTLFVPCYSLASSILHTMGEFDSTRVEILLLSMI